MIYIYIYSNNIVSSFVPSAITQPFFELQTPDFAWKFVWIVQINYKSTKVQKVQKSTKKYISTKVLITQSFLELQTPDFAWKFICTVQPNEKVQKYKKYKKYKSTKSTKSTKVQKYRKIKNVKSTKHTKNELKVWTP